jgi:hypothetical protein
MRHLGKIGDDRPALGAGLDSAPVIQRLFLELA